MKESALFQSTRRQNNVNRADPVSMLKQDHSKVKDLFDQFEDTDDRETQMDLAKTALQELKVHAAIEEEIFYPAAKQMMDDQEVMHEALEEHHVAHMLIDELEGGNLDPETFHAKFKVLAESVRHHIKEEEGQMLPKLDTDEGDMERIGARMAQRKEELMENPEELRPRTRKTAQSRSRTAGKTSAGRSTGRTATKARKR